jgi:hypothetical protein
MKQQIASYVLKEKNDFAKSQKAHQDSIDAVNQLQSKLSEIE